MHRGRDHRVTLTTAGHRPGDGAVHVAGVDVSHLVTKCTVTAEVGRLPTVQLEMLAWPVDVDCEPADVELPPALVELLSRLGWTPPATTPPPVHTGQASPLTCGNTDDGAGL